MPTAEATADSCPAADHALLASDKPSPLISKFTWMSSTCETCGLGAILGCTYHCYLGPHLIVLQREGKVGARG